MWPLTFDLDMTMFCEELLKLSTALLSCRSATITNGAALVQAFKFVHVLINLPLAVFLLHVIGWQICGWGNKRLRDCYGECLRDSSQAGPNCWPCTTLPNLWIFTTAATRSGACAPMSD